MGRRMRLAAVVRSYDDPAEMDQNQEVPDNG